MAHSPRQTAGYKAALADLDVTLVAGREKTWADLHKPEAAQLLGLSEETVAYLRTLPPGQTLGAIFAAQCNEGHMVEAKSDGSMVTARRSDPAAVTGPASKPAAKPA